MKTIKLKVTIEVPDDYVIDEPEWTLEECYIDRNSKCEVIDVTEIRNK